MQIHDLIDLDRYPLDQPNSPEWQALVAHSRSQLDRDGLFSLPGFLKANALQRVLEALLPDLEQNAFTHARRHNIYFRDVPELARDHPALQRHETVNHTLCGDQLMQNEITRVYEYAGLITFLAAVMDLPGLFTMADPLARVNVMQYRHGEALNWHFDGSEFTTTLLLQAPVSGGAFSYRRDLRRADDPNYDGVARLLAGDDPEERILELEAGTLNIFRGRNTAHRVTPVEGDTSRIIAVFSYYEQPGVMFTKEQRTGFYGRSE